MFGGIKYHTHFTFFALYARLYRITMDQSLLEIISLAHKGFVKLSNPVVRTELGMRCTRYDCAWKFGVVPQTVITSEGIKNIEVMRKLERMKLWEEGNL